MQTVRINLAYIHQRKIPCDHYAIQDIPFCSALKEIHVATTCRESKITLDESFITRLGKASDDKKLPNLTSMTIDGSYRDMSQLFMYK